jgi:branched-chain amino acid transport system ATP-binding protein
MLTLNNITKSFGGVAAIRGTNFRVAPHSATALIGPNGAGKTTLFDIISGLVKPDTGSIVLESEEISRLSPPARANRGISRTFQQVRLFRYLTILDHLILAEKNDDTKLLKTFFSRQSPDYDTYQKTLDSFGIKKSVLACVSELSFGQRKLLQIAMALRRPHKLLLLDEPVAGVNKVVQSQIEELLLTLKTAGETILLIDHDMQFVRRLSDRIIALDAGVVIAEGEPKEVLQNSAVIEAYLGV